VAFLVPSNNAQRVYKQILENGMASYARLGINAEPVTPLLAKQANLPRSSGALVSAVDGPAREAGLSAGSEQVVFAGKPVQLGDLVTSIAGSKVTSGDDILRIVSRLDVGANVEVVFYRDGKRQTVMLTTAARS
jgi:serine protease Do